MKEFESLRAQLLEQEWPNVYLFKFIVKNSEENLAKTMQLFDGEAEVKTQPSKNGTFVSVSAKELMLDVDSIINKYKQAQTIPGIISL
ncbi:MAG: hypothetical protein ACI9XP_001606 [Lentimonas sp.]|jgi:hypothetical protein